MNPEIVDFETKVEKACAEWVLTVAKLLAKKSGEVEQRTHVLRQKIMSVPLPQKTDPKELQKIPIRINEILRQESLTLKGVVDMKLKLEIDVKARKLKDKGHQMTGAFSQV